MTSILGGGHKTRLLTNSLSILKILWEPMAPLLRGPCEVLLQSVAVAHVRVGVVTQGHVNKLSLVLFPLLPILLMPSFFLYTVLCSYSLMSLFLSFIFPCCCSFSF